MRDYFDDINVDCPYKKTCASKGFRCRSCRNNKKVKEDHYEPFYPNPWKPWNPEINPKPIIWWCCGDIRTKQAKRGKKDLTK